jgi:hypothetical protein
MEKPVHFPALEKSAGVVEGSTECNTCAAAFRSANAVGCAAMNAGWKIAVRIVIVTVVATGIHLSILFPSHEFLGNCRSGLPIQF